MVPSSDVFDELDQFVDSEPVGWSERPGRHGAADHPAATVSRAAPAPAADESAAVDVADAAFSRSGALSRREAFAQRLSEELDRPASSVAPPAPKPEPPRAGGPAITPRPATADGARPAQPPPRPAAPKAASGPQPSALRTGTTTTVRPAPQQLLSRPAARPQTESPPQRPAAQTAPPPPAPEETVPPDYEIDLLASDLLEDDDAPVDALEWELDNAISAIVQNNHKASAAEPSAPPAANPADEPAAPAQSAEAAPRAPRDPLQPAEAPVAPQAPVGTRRTRPVPSFQFDRRQEVDEPAAAPTDFDNPLSRIFFQDVRDHFDAVHPKGAEALDDDDPGVAVPDMGPDGLDEEYTFSEDDDRLPPSLSRASRRRGAFGLPVTGIAAAVIAVCVVVALGAIGFNVLAGGGGAGGTPPVIHADARDVKVRAESEGVAAEPDIMERTQLGETEELVLPDRVEIGRAAPSITLDSDSEDQTLASRRVRTVVVRPDGTIVPASPANDGAAEAVRRQSAASVRETSLPAPDAADPLPSSDVAAAETGGTADAPGSLGAGSETPAFASASGEATSLEAGPAATPAETDLEEPQSDAATTAVLPPRRPKPPQRTARVASAPAAPAPVATAARGPDLGASRSIAAAPAATATQQRTAPIHAAWGVQVSSQRNRSDAEQSFANLQARYPAILAGIEPMIVPADLADRGLFYRVRLPASSRSEAAALCQQLKAAGADCFIGRN